MGKLLLIMGDLATGKSTFAHMLSQRYDTVVFYKDAIKEVLGDTIGFSNRAENKKLSVATAELMSLIFSGFGKRNKNLILESNFRIAELEVLHKIAAEYGYQVLTLVLNGDAEILHQRYLNRMHNENRHPVHLCAEFNTREGFQAYIESLRVPELPGSVLRIRADDFSYQQDPALLEKIDGFMKFDQNVVKKRCFHLDKQAVYDFLATIPKGKVVTYGQIGEYFGDRRLARTVGNILHQNPDGVKYPCYKVVNHQGKLAAQYAFGGIAAQRQRLLDEGIPVENDGVDLVKYQYRPL